MSDTELGLRDRKRLQTRARLEKAAVELVLRDGLQHATVDAICEMAEVSPRTFFNYFESKDDAILGLSDLTVPEPGRLQGRDTDVLASLIGLMVEMTTATLEDRSLAVMRAKLLKRYPELFTKHVTRLDGLSKDFLTVVTALMKVDPRFTYLAGATSPLAELILALCIASVRTSAKEWIAAGSDAPIDDIRIRAIALARETVEKLQ